MIKIKYFHVVYKVAVKNHARGQESFRLCKNDELIKSQTSLTRHLKFEYIDNRALKCEKKGIKKGLISAQKKYK